MRYRSGKMLIYIMLLNASCLAYATADFLFPDHIKDDSSEDHQTWFETDRSEVPDRGTSDTWSDVNTKFVGEHDDSHYRLPANRCNPSYDGHLYPGWPGRHTASHRDGNMHAVSHGTGSSEVNSHSKSEASASSSFPSSWGPYGPTSGSSQSESTANSQNSWNPHGHFSGSSQSESTANSQNSWDPQGHFSGSSQSKSTANSQNSWDPHGHSASSAAASSSSVSSGFLGGSSSSAAAAAASAGGASASAAASSSSSSSSSSGFRTSGFVPQGLAPLFLRSGHEGSPSSEEKEEERLIFKD